MKKLQIKIWNEILDILSDRSLKEPVQQVDLKNIEEIIQKALSSGSFTINADEKSIIKTETKEKA